jgi:hypothetical protein
VAVLLENGEHVVIIPHRFLVQQDRRKTLDPQRRCREQRAFEALRDPVAHSSPRRPTRDAARFFVVGDFAVEKGLNLLGRLEAPQKSQLIPPETVVARSPPGILSHEL